MNAGLSLFGSTCNWPNKKKRIIMFEDRLDEKKLNTHGRIHCTLDLQSPYHLTPVVDFLGIREK